MSGYTHAAGILVPVFALRRPDDFGIGDTRCMMEAIDFCTRYNMRLLQVLPINETGDDNSPYNTISSVALDPVYLTLEPEMVPGLTPQILRELTTPDQLEKLRRGPVNYRVVKPLKLQILAEAFVNFFEPVEDPGVPEEVIAEQMASYRTFCEDHADWLRPYTVFRTLLNMYEGNAMWPSWNPEHQSYEAACDWIASDPDLSNDEGDFVRYQCFTIYLQWLSWRQWAAVRAYADDKQVELVGDIPFGISRYSVDVWANRQLFDLEWCGGAPPEPFFPGDKFLRTWGQNWGIPLYKWDAHREEDFAWWKLRVQTTSTIFHGFRIDHVLGFFRVWSFPWTPQDNSKYVDLTKEEAKKLAGDRIPQFLPFPDQPEENAAANVLLGKEVLTIIQAASGQTSIIAEDLGVTPPYVPETLAEMGIAGFNIPHFNKTKDGKDFLAASTFKPVGVATWGTHDHSPLRTWYEDLTTRWHGPSGHEPWLELQRIMRFLGKDENQPPRDFTQDLHRTMLRVLLSCPAHWVIFNITDILDLKMRFNSPGTSADSNWSQRLDKTLNAYAEQPNCREMLTVIKQLIEANKRDGTVHFEEPPKLEKKAVEHDMGALSQPQIADLEAEARALLIEREETEKGGSRELPKIVERK